MSGGGVENDGHEIAGHKIAGHENARHEVARHARFCATCIGQKLSPRLSTTSGVRQGCVLASILYCVAIDWIIQHMSFNPAITVGSSTFTDLVYADDTALLFLSATDATTSLKSFSDSASHPGLNIS